LLVNLKNILTKESLWRSFKELKAKTCADSAGNNLSTDGSSKINMTAPVVLEPTSAVMDMTAPVLTEGENNEWIVSFAMIF
jgi:CheY-specific phosphatase CheX